MKGSTRLAILTGVLSLGILYAGVGYNSAETITLVQYGPVETDIKVVSDTGFYTKFGSTGQEVYQRKTTFKFKDGVIAEYSITTDAVLQVKYAPPED